MAKDKNTNLKFNNKKKNTYNGDIKKLPIIVGTILLILAVVYFGIEIFKNNSSISKDTNKDNNSVTTIQYAEILAGEIFNKKDEDYYVICGDSKGNYFSLYKNIADKDASKIIYLVDTNNPLNTKYISSESNSAVQNVNELKLKPDTLIHIMDSKNVLYIEGKNEILNYFK